ncbi:MAG: pitrilysin family protein [Kiritimatiellaeota bacterium]|nr:pitrilysin family protein [Kiritimatiellota bacterium]
MKSIFIRLALFSLLLVSACAQEVVELKLPQANKVIIKLMFRNGSVCDPQGKEGLTQLTTTLITEGGTSNLTHAQITDLIYPLAAAYGSSVDKEVVVFTFGVPAVFLDAFYPIVKGLLLTPSFTPEDFNRVLSNQRNYIDEVIRASSDEEYSKKALEDMLFRRTPYQHPVAGTSQGLRAISLEDVKAHYAHYFTRHNLTIGLAGNYSRKFLATLKEDLVRLSPVRPTLPRLEPAAMPEGFQVEIIAKDHALGSAICAGFPLNLTRAGDEFAALMVANSWLGEHRKSYSRLYQKIREARSMNYGDYSYIEWYQDGGGHMLPPPGVPRHENYFSIWIRPVQTAQGLKTQYPELRDLRIGHAHFALRLAVRELGLLIQQGLAEEAFQLTREFLRSYIKLYIQTPERQLGYLMDSRFYGRKDYIAEMDRLLSKLTRADVNRAVKKYWQTGNMAVVIVTDKGEAEDLARSLRAQAPTPMSYSDNLKSALSSDILAEDQVIEKYPLPVRSVTIVNSADTFRACRARSMENTRYE